jgi:hypothetical protein
MGATESTHLYKDNNENNEIYYFNRSSEPLTIKQRNCDDVEVVTTYKINKNKNCRYIVFGDGMTLDVITCSYIKFCNGTRTFIIKNNRNNTLNNETDINVYVTDYQYKNINISNTSSENVIVKHYVEKNLNITCSNTENKFRNTIILPNSQVNFINVIDISISNLCMCLGREVLPYNSTFGNISYSVNALNSSTVEFCFEDVNIDKS